MIAFNAWYQAVQTVLAIMTYGFVGIFKMAQKAGNMNKPAKMRGVLKLKILKSRGIPDACWYHRVTAEMVSPDDERNLVGTYFDCSPYEFKYLCDEWELKLAHEIESYLRPIRLANKRLRRLAKRNRKIESAQRSLRRQQEIFIVDILENLVPHIEVGFKSHNDSSSSDHMNKLAAVLRTFIPKLP